MSGTLLKIPWRKYILTEEGKTILEKLDGKYL